MHPGRKAAEGQPHSKTFGVLGLRLLGFATAALLAFAFTGCAGRSAKSNAQARAAYAAGQQQAMERILQARNSVTVIGPVRNPMVLWTADMTLAKALIEADYYPRGSPHQIVVVRNGQPMSVDPKQLLAGDDIPLEAGDVIQIK